jgi:hypothetical protein
LLTATQVSGNIPKGGTRNIQSHKFSKSERFPWHAKVVLKPRKDDEQEVDASITGMGTQVRGSSFVWMECVVKQAA